MKKRALSATRVLQTAEQLCSRRVLRFTALRRRVLKIVCNSPQPLKAYDILNEYGDNARPPTVYRALDFLQTNGFLHKIKSQGTYIVCRHPQTPHTCYFLLCKICGQSEESRNLQLKSAVAAAAAAADFTPHNVMVEIEGVCSTCHPQA
ncbi:MAG: transcriptional repressor [Gammaproteobacteria bacterium WSBS_2016_MAG_OTU1]